MKTLRHNHLISPDDYSGVPDSIALTLKFVTGYSHVADYLAPISRNPYTRGRDANWLEALPLLSSIQRYKFTGGPSVYHVEVEAA